MKFHVTIKMEHTPLIPIFFPIHRFALLLRRRGLDCCMQTTLPPKSKSNA